MFAAPSVGAIVTGVFISARPPIREVGKWVLLGVLFFGVCLVLFAVVPIFWLSLVFLAGSGAGNTVSAVLRGTTNQLLTPDHLRGRMSAINSAFVFGGPQLGQFRSGVVADLWGASFAGAAGGVGAIVCVAAIALLPGIMRFKMDPTGKEEVVGEPAGREGSGM